MKQRCIFFSLPVPTPQWHSYYSFSRSAHLVHFPIASEESLENNINLTVLEENINYFDKFKDIHNVMTMFDLKKSIHHHV